MAYAKQVAKVTGQSRYLGMWKIGSKENRVGLNFISHETHSHWGRIWAWETDSGTVLIVEHTADAQGVRHFHASHAGYVYEPGKGIVKDLHGKPLIKKNVPIDESMKANYTEFEPSHMNYYVFRNRVYGPGGKVLSKPELELLIERLRVEVKNLDTAADELTNMAKRDIKLRTASLLKKNIERYEIAGKAVYGDRKLGGKQLKSLRRAMRATEEDDEADIGKEASVKAAQDATDTMVKLMNGINVATFILAIINRPPIPSPYELMLQSRANYLNMKRHGFDDPKLDRAYIYNWSLDPRA